MRKQQNDKLSFTLINENKQVILTKKTPSKNQGFIMNKFANVKDFYNKPITLTDWITKLKTLKISDGSLDEDFLVKTINANNEELLRLSKIKNNFKKDNQDIYTLKHNKHLKHYQKNLNKEINDYLELVDDVIYNVEADWNDAHNFHHKLNLYDTTIQKVNDENKTKSMLIEKPNTHSVSEIKSNKDVVWNSQIIQECNEHHKNNFDAKSYTKYLNSISYNSVAGILSKTIDEAFSVRGITNALKNLWEVISTKKISVLKTPIYSLLNSLQEDSKTVHKIVKQLNKNLISYTTSPDIELLNDILYHINVEDALTNLEAEINHYRTMFDIILRKYSIAQHIAKDLFIKEIKAAANFDSRINGEKKRNPFAKNGLLENEITEVKTTEPLANYQYANKFRKSLYSSILQSNKISNIVKKDKSIDETLLNSYFHKINVEAGIIYDLNDLLKLLSVQYKKDKQKTLNLKHIDDQHMRDVVSYVYQQGLLTKELEACNMIYKNILLHLRNLLTLQQDLELLLTKSQQNWLVYFDKWIEFKKAYINKNNHAFKNLPNEPLEICLDNKDIDKKTVNSHAKEKNTNLKTLKNKFSNAGVKIQEIINATKIDLQNTQDKLEAKDN